MALIAEPYKIIFHGDDYGLSPGLNKGVENAFLQGLLKSASLMAQGEGFAQAVDFARSHPGLDLGVHLFLCDEAALTSVEAIYRGRFKGAVLPDRNTLFAAACAKRLDLDAVRAEFLAQIRAVLDQGLCISHLDSHQFVHLFPGLLQVTMDLAKSHGIKHVRNLLADPPMAGAGFPRLLQWAVLRLWIAFYVKPRLEPGPACVPAVGFAFSGGRLGLDCLAAILARVLGPYQAVEVILHPGLACARSMEKYKHWNYCWEKDVALATDPALPVLLERLGARACSFLEIS